MVYQDDKKIYSSLLGMLIVRAELNNCGSDMIILELYLKILE